ncbi:hypothetical protein [Shinella zoogloeoides]|uniref:hypothetical protein n=1 Tax=Shinella zoogloeoides TaxID=352475 RepID=UPI00273D93BD|nr:hypothetical protein [Shinella zoogloeoides]WLR92187.1 hypothetical protein Q9316_17225 [Shinella zoogloeoides]
MLTALQSGAQYPSISDDILAHHKGETFAWIAATAVFGEEGPTLPVEATQEQIADGYRRIRQYLFTSKTDPMFFKVQRGEIEMSEYLDAVDSIKNEWAWRGDGTPRDP